MPLTDGLRYFREECHTQIRGFIISNHCGVRRRRHLRRQSIFCANRDDRRNDFCGRPIVDSVMLMLTCCTDTPLPDFRSFAPQNLPIVAAMLAREKLVLFFEVFYARLRCSLMMCWCKKDGDDFLVKKMTVALNSVFSVV